MANKDYSTTIKDYIATINFCSKELDVKQRIAFKDVSDCISLDEATQQDAVIINVDYYGKVDIHNEKSDNKDYSKYIIADKDGQRYVTGSESFWRSLTEIADEVTDAGLPDWAIRVFRRPSKNYKGKDFITCSII